MELPYSNFDHCLLFNSLNDSPDLKKAIGYLVSFNEYEDLKINALNHSILIYNDEIAIYIILYVGFERNEFIQNMMLNSHYVSFQTITSSMFEFKDIEIKYLDKLAVLFTALSISDKDCIIDFNTFLNTSS